MPDGIRLWGNKGQKPTELSLGGLAQLTKAGVDGREQILADGREVSLYGLSVLIGRGSINPVYQLVARANNALHDLDKGFALFLIVNQDAGVAIVDYLAYKEVDVFLQVSPFHRSKIKIQRCKISKITITGN